MPYLIDGHNLLWSIRQNDERFEPVETAGLCRTIGLYLNDVGDSGEVVFDGAGPMDKRDFYGIRGLRVIFAGPGTDADTVIEGKIRASRARRKLCIVSNDRRVRAAGQRVKARVMGSDAFWEAVLKRLLRKRPAAEPPGKRRGLSDSETEQWLKRLGLRP